MLKFLLICVLFCVSVSSQSDENVKQKFEEFIIKFNRQYRNEKEKALRFANFMKNVKKAEELNKLYQEDHFGITKFSDWSEEETQGILGYKPVKDANVESLVPLTKFNQGPAPAAWDWRDHNAVTPIKNQAICGSCWAFSAIGNIEGRYALKHHNLVSLSEQQLVDCVKNQNISGCNGGFMDSAFEILTKSGQLVETESSYPYKAIDDECHYNKKEGVAHVIGLNYINVKNEDELKQALYEYGPLAFGMYAYGLVLWSGSGDIFPGCGNVDSKDHGLVLIGYGTSDAGEEYWIVKNSWGKLWNDGGWFNMKRGINICNILERNNIVTAEVA